MVCNTPILSRNRLEYPFTAVSDNAFDKKATAEKIPYQQFLMFKETKNTSRLQVAVMDPDLFLLPSKSERKGFDWPLKLRKLGDFAKTWSPGQFCNGKSGKKSALLLIERFSKISAYNNDWNFSNLECFGKKRPPENARDAVLWVSILRYIAVRAISWLEGRSQT